MESQRTSCPTPPRSLFQRARRSSHVCIFAALDHKIGRAKYFRCLVRITAQNAKIAGGARGAKLGSRKIGAVTTLLRVKTHLQYRTENVKAEKYQKTVAYNA